LYNTTTATDPKPFPSYDDKWKSNSSSVVFLIAALRETRCPDTLHYLFTHAAHPTRVFAGSRSCFFHMSRCSEGVVQQNEEDDPDCLVGMCELFGTPLTKIDGEFKNTNNCPFYDNVRMVNFS
jgi:hypothetical protein